MKESLNQVWEMPKEQFQDHVSNAIGLGAALMGLALIGSFCLFKYISYKWDKEWEKNKDKF